MGQRGGLDLELELQRVKRLAQHVLAHHQRSGVELRDRVKHRLELHIAALRRLDHRRAQSLSVMAHQIQVHAQVVDLQLEVIGQTHQHLDRTDRAGDGQPLGVIEVALAVEDGQAKLHIAHAQAPGLGVELAVFEAAVAIGVAAIGAQTHKTGQARAAHAEHLGLHFCAVGQRHLLRAPLQTHGAAELHKVGQVQFHRTAGAHQSAGVTGHVQRDALASAGDHLEVFFAAGEVDHLGVGIQLGLDATDQVDVDCQIARGQRHAGHAHKGHRAGLGLERRPLQACAAVGAWRRIGQHQGKVHPAHGQAH